MKKLSFRLIIILMLGMLSCHNAEVDFPDFDYTTVYFPYQYPVRTLVLGDYILDNESDNNLKFLISARVGGMYTNDRDWSLDFEINEDLSKNIIYNGDTLEMLPSQYFTLEPENTILIPKGEFSGGTEVQLTEAFLDDPLSVKIHYVIPLTITSTNADSILSGYTLSTNPDPRISGNWSISPRNFTLFGIKYVNAYHGKYLHRGASVIKDAISGSVIETIVYRQSYVEKDEVWSLTTTGRNEVTVTGVLRSSPSSPGNFIMKLNFNSNGGCTITNDVSSTFPVTGTGKFVHDGDEWGNEKRDVIHINYQVTQGTKIHTITDTLVFRDKDVRFEEFLPVVY